MSQCSYCGSEDHKQHCDCGRAATIGKKCAGCVPKAAVPLAEPTVPETPATQPSLDPLVTLWERENGAAIERFCRDLGMSWEDAGNFKKPDPIDWTMGGVWSEAADEHD